MAIWLTSDWHFAHDGEFIWKPRGFNSVDEMNKEIVRLHNEIVDINDDIYVLGDLMLGDDGEGMNYLRQLHGKLHIVRGNHDTSRRIKLYSQLSQVVKIEEALTLKYAKYNFFLCHYPCLTSNNDNDKPLKARVINLCGHYHTTNKFEDMERGILAYHVEVDAHDCAPKNIEDIITDIKEYYKRCDK